MAQFTWLPFFAEMLHLIRGKFQKTNLTRVFHEIFSGVGGQQDRYREGGEGPLREIDPLTFIAYFNRNDAHSRRATFCDAARKYFTMSSETPADFDGIPIVDARNTWFFGWEKNRGEKDFDTLWSLGHELDKSQVTERLFNEALSIQKMGLTKLTQLMFICKPQDYISLDKKNIAYLKAKGVIGAGQVKKLTSRFSDYKALIERVREHFGARPFHEISYDAYQYDEQAQSEDGDAGKRCRSLHSMQNGPYGQEPVQKRATSTCASRILTNWT